jgi:hypothetical protein
MRILAIGSVLAFSLFAVACSDDDRPNDVPRTVPPAVDGAASSDPVVKGVGPTIEAAGFVANAET